ncbi:hypothetical protein CEXT_16061 [Caerostris extrusa]|uniref:Uncharacterized protein n=1 Tax=Caerostris extrusa TaxID=172846 RepID=A0AAV4VCL7_CAEEX|nr:hypothetical protein CEXT_16061 [Caerostris extrusa]
MIQILEDFSLSFLYGDDPLKTSNGRHFIGVFSGVYQWHRRLKSGVFSHTISAISFSSFRVCSPSLRPLFKSSVLVSPWTLQKITICTLSSIANPLLI